MRPLTFSLPVVEAPDYAKAEGAVGRVVIIWRKPVKHLMGDAYPFEYYDVVGMDERGNHFKFRIPRNLMEDAIRNPCYFIQLDTIRGPSMEIKGNIPEER